MSWEKNVRTVEPYVPGEQPKEQNIIKLNTNENPYGPSEKVKACVVDTDVFRKYPDPTASLLVDSIAAYHGVASENVFVGVGSDDVLAMAFMTFFNDKERPVLFPDITYSFYPVWAEMLRIPYETVALDENYRIPENAFDKENGGIVFPNPNAPTAILCKKDFIVDVLNKNKDVVVIVDEAYIDFAEPGDSVMDLISEYENLLVVRTFSKSRSMAGMRIGYAVGSKKLIKYMSDVKYSYNSYTMNMPSILYGAASIEDEAYFCETVGKIKATREWFVKELEKLSFTVLPSSANFVFASPAKKNAKELFEKAKKEGIYFRYFNAPRIDTFLRITIGVDEDMEKVVRFFKENV